MEIKYKKEDDYEEFYIEGKARMGFYVFYEYEEYFDEDLNPEERKEFFKLTKYEPIIILEHLEVFNDSRGEGLAGLLMNHFNDYVKSKGYDFVYLNAFLAWTRVLI